jgi:group I intron endonuclease
MIAGHVYLITNLVNGRKYVGCTKNSIEHRWKKHLREAKKGTRALCRAIRRYGAEQFKLECLEVVVGGHGDLMAAEIRHIGLQNSVAPRGYNLTRGGDSVDFTVPEVRERHLQAVRRLAADPKWRANNAANAKKLAADPGWKRAHAEGVRRRVANPEWRATNAETNRQLSQDPDWQAAHAEGVRKRTSDPTWATDHAEKLRRLHTDPEMIRRHAAGSARMASRPEWQAQHAEMIRKRSENRNWKESQKKSLRLACEARLAKALERDALCSPEERERRIKRREAVRRSAAKRKRERLARVL